jgi:SAM-dependent methyltransferase
VAVPSRHDRAWEDWGSVDPLYAILTDPKYRHGAGDRAEFMDSGEDFAASILGRCEALGLATGRGGALDFGCGVGRVSAPLSTSFETVVGLDVSPSMVETARRLHATRPNCRFEVQRTTDLRQYSDASFDLVLCVLVLQHLGSQQAILRYLAEFVRVLAPGGALVVQIPSKVPPPRLGTRNDNDLTSRRAHADRARRKRRIGGVRHPHRCGPGRDRELHLFRHPALIHDVPIAP